MVSDDMDAQASHGCSQASNIITITNVGASLLINYGVFNERGDNTNSFALQRIADKAVS